MKTFTLPKLTSVPFKEFIGKPRQELKDHLEKEYKDRSPDQEVLDYLLSHPEAVPEEMKLNWHYFFKLTFRYSDGYAYVPSVRWNGDELDRGSGWLDYDWYGRERVVLLDDSEPLSSVELNPLLCSCEITSNDEDNTTTAAIVLLKEKGFKITKIIEREY